MIYNNRDNKLNPQTHKFKVKDDTMLIDITKSVMIRF